MPGAEAHATFDLVRSLVAGGADVTVVSPVPSAAHHHADPGGARGALRLASLASGADRVVIRIDAQALQAHANPASALLGRLALASALRRAKVVEAIVDRVPTSVSRRWAKLVLGGADTITVGSEPERDALVSAGVAAGRLNVAASPPAEDLPARRALQGDERLPRAASARELQQLIRERAAAMWAGASAPAGRASLPLRHLPPLERASVKRLQARLLGWQFDWVIEHLNKLHQATIEAVESVEAVESQPRRGKDRKTS
jgi:hypothetical protein